MRRWIAGAVVAAVGCFEPVPDFPVVTCGTPDLTISLGAEGFTPADASVKYGGEVQWMNDDTVERTIQSGTEGDDRAGEAFDSGPQNDVLLFAF